ncbi:hypothetical protein DVR12_03985 [Chitinophaga silvatica]|uniref:Lipocalin-like domain-containing protein n=1 Tax=Chitinophaga silvatica TaxID=2282649 RepID=A0A3E1YI09_9BACT|nr:hypothetical protein DVR12_03985 [Chitinophaga silvatica]
MPSVICATSFLAITLFANSNPPKPSPLLGTWKLISSKLISKGDTTNTTPPAGQEMIKVFTNSQFSFFTHDLNKGKGEKPVFSAGSGTYTLQGNVYKEHLVFCSFRDWENQDFTFTMTIKKDTIEQRGIERIENLGVDHEIVETYVRVGN